jgi:ribosomal protein S3
LIRNYISFHFPETVSVEVERTDTELFVYVYTFNSNLVSGERENDNNNSLKQALVKIINDKKISVKVDFRLDRDSAQALVNDLVQQLQKDPAG